MPISLPKTSSLTPANDPQQTERSGDGWRPPKRSAAYDFRIVSVMRRVPAAF